MGWDTIQPRVTQTPPNVPSLHNEENTRPQKGETEFGDFLLNLPCFLVLIVGLFVDTDAM